MTFSYRASSRAAAVGVGAWVLCLLFTVCAMGSLWDRQRTRSARTGRSVIAVVVERSWPAAVTLRYEVDRQTWTTSVRVARDFYSSIDVGQTLLVRLHPERERALWFEGRASPTGREIAGYAAMSAIAFVFGSWQLLLFRRSDRPTDGGDPANGLPGAQRGAPRPTMGG